MANGRALRCYVVFLALLLSAGCRVDRGPMDASHAERVASIDAEMNTEIAESDKRWSEIAEDVRGRRRFLVEVDAASGKPVAPVVARFVPAWEACATPIDASPPLLPQPPSAEEIEAYQQAVRDEYWRALGRHYYKADFQWVDAQRASDPNLDLEALCARSHNQSITTDIEATLAKIEGHKAEFRASMDRIRQDRVAFSAQQRDQEVAEADRARRQVWAAALQGFAQGMQNASQSSSSTPSYTRPSTSYGTTTPSYTSPSTNYAGSPSASAGGCTSDFSCGIGNKCVKNYYRAQGVCMKAVNEYGVRTFTPPDPSSVGPNTPDQSSCNVTSCPIGFRCDLKSGVCVR